MEEVLPEVEKIYKLRPDGYSRAIAGESSGGICAFNVAWLLTDKFSRVHSAVGSFTSIQWRPQDKQDGGNVYPFLVRKDPKKNIRVWLSDGSEDLENQFGSWPVQAIADGEFAEDEGLRFPFPLRRGGPRRRAGGTRPAGVARLAVARLRSREDRADLRAGGVGEREAALPGADLQSQRLVASNGRRDREGA